VERAGANAAMEMGSSDKALRLCCHLWNMMIMVSALD
jgi:hypothetical protein